MFEIDWEALFYPSIPPLELILRGSITYLAVFILLRVVLKREAGSVSISDLLVIVLLADAVQNALSGGYTSITDGIILVTTILLVAFVIDWLAYKFPAIQRFIHPKPLKLMENGRFLYRNMRREFVTKDEMMSHLRLNGVEDISNVKEAYMEGDGQISIVKVEGEGESKPKKKRPA